MKLRASELTEWGSCTLISGVTIRGGTCRYSYYYDFKQFLFQPEMYGKINLQVQSKFTSTYALALYENCVRYRGLPLTKWFSMEDYRLLMGVSDNKYMIFRDFKKRVLDKSVSEVNTLSDIRVLPELRYSGRKPVFIRFKLSEAASCLDNNEQTLKQELRPELMKLVSFYKLSEIKAQSLLKKYGVDYLLEKIELVESSNSFRAGQIKSVSGYLIKAIEEGYSSDIANKVAVSKEIREKDERERKAFKEERAKIDKQIESSKLRLKEVNLWIKSIPSVERIELMDGFKQYIMEENKILLKWFDYDKVEVPVLSFFMDYVAFRNK